MPSAAFSHGTGDWGWFNEEKKPIPTLFPTTQTCVDPVKPQNSLLRRTTLTLGGGPPSPSRVAAA